MGDVSDDDQVATALRALDSARGRFVAVVGHELRTPMTTLRGLAEELVSTDDAGRAELAPAVLRSARRIEGLLDDLLLATEITTVLPVGEPEEVDLVATAQAVWDGQAEESPDGVAGDLELLGASEAVVEMRPGAADTMLERILDNARRYGRPPHSLHAEVDDGRVRLKVTSAGADMAPDDIQLAFELFYRGEGAVTTAPGFGLGLPVARALARQHHGDLRLEPHPGGGLEVIIELPASG
ncbi:MAG TPA: HAMP domain-containing sensor histidine kinase [Acidimicrobiales bacterium]